MAKEKKKFYVTTSIAYTNAKPHIGFALEVLQADVLARHHCLKGEDVLFLTGTDENGLKIFRTAKKAGRKPQEFVDEISIQFKNLKNVLNLSNDDFIRTSDQKRHWPTVQYIWQKLKDNGDVYKKKYKGLYCVGCEAFLTEKDLVGGKCPNHQKEPEVVEEENYFFRLSRYQDKLKDILESNKIKIVPESKKNEMLSFINQGLEDVSCSRERSKLEWGVPVPDDEKQIVYVWFEALINYLSALDYAENSDKFKKYWPADVHCIGKDIVRFHSLLWPAMILSLGLDLPKVLFIHGYITSNGQKMSKSLGNVVDPFELVKKYGADPVRYFLLREISPTEDGDFTVEKFEERYNADLASGLGNLLARVTTLANKIFNNDIVILSEAKNLKYTKRPFGKYLRVTPSVSFSNHNFETIINKTKKDYQKSLENFKFNETLGAVWQLISFCDRYIEENRPWEGGEKAEQVVSDLLIVLQEIADLLKAFLPETSEKILEQLKTGKSEPLFPRLA